MIQLIALGKINWLRNYQICKMGTQLMSLTKASCSSAHSNSWINFLNLRLKLPVDDIKCILLFFFFSYCFYHHYYLVKVSSKLMKINHFFLKTTDNPTWEMFAFTWKMFPKRELYLGFLICHCNKMHSKTEWLLYFYIFCNLNILIK